MQINTHFNELIHRLIRHRHHHHWSYEDDDGGPQNWPNTNGDRQSPINIESSVAVFDQNLVDNPLVIDYDLESCSRISNNGHTFLVEAHHHHKSRIRGGPAKNEFIFSQFHMHWGDLVEVGSEHLIDGQAFSAELHFVNWNHELYKSSSVASKSKFNDGLLVLAVFVKIGKFNTEFEKLSKCMHEIHLKNHHTDLENIDMFKLMPENRKDYWTYPGSMTTPPCYESVTWVVLKDPIELTQEQLHQCHKLYQVSKEKFCSEHTAIRYNDRPICPLGDRVIYKSFE